MIIAFFVALFIGTHPLQTDQARPAESDSVKSSFIMGTEDFFWQTGWNYSSIERMSVMLNSGNYGFYGPQPSFMLNDIPFDPTFFGVTYSQLFPVSFFRVENRDIRQGAGVKNGVLYQSGLMNITSEPLKEGISVFGTGQIGHNSGEPGPWVFDPVQVTPNVERFGPWVDGGLSLRHGDWYAKGIIRYHSYINIDEFIQTRLFNIRGFPQENLWLDLEATTTLGLAEAGYDGTDATIRLQAVQSDSEEFLFFQPFAREIPTGLSTEQYSALGIFRFSDRTGVRSLLQLREMSTKYRTNRFDYDFGWARNEQIIRGSVYHQRDRYGLDAGTEIERSETDARGMEQNDVTITSFFADQYLNLSNSVHFGTTAVMQTMEGVSPVIQGSALFDIELIPGWRVQFEGGYEELFPETSDPVDLLVSRGYDLYSHLGIPGMIPPEIENTQLRTLSHRQFISLPYSINLELDLRYTEHLSLNIPVQNALYNLTFSTQPGFYSLHQEKGSQFKAGLALTHTWNDNVSQQLGLTVNQTLDGEEAYRNYWDMIPGYHIQYSVLYNPYPDIELNLNFEYMPERRWAEFDNLDGRLNRSFHIQYPFTYYRFTNTLPEIVNVDLRISKWFWQQRLRTALQLKNLLNNHYQTHPLGVRERFGYMVRLELRI
jgi:hypothetical protein